MIPKEADEILGRAVARTNQWVPDGAAIVWAEDLEHVSFEDAKEALRNIGARPLRDGERREITPRDIIAEVRRIRRERMDKFDASQSDPPPGLDAATYIQWLRGERERAANGLPPTRQPALTARPTADVIAGIRRRLGGRAA